ncbi:MAG: twin-arginine translocase TatA/TatE family subunit [Armatimonadota bacterium]|nr:twin-arginine translocase TatA/TatE family subunit [Armatimonadota bacterium]
MFPLAFGFGNPVEIAIIAGVIILLFGGQKLAGLGKSMGEGIREFKKATQEDDPPGPDPAASTTPPVGANKTEEK